MRVSARDQRVHEPPQVGPLRLPSTARASLEFIGAEATKRKSRVWPGSRGSGCCLQLGG